MGKKRCFIKYSFEDSQQPLKREHCNTEMTLDFSEDIVKQVKTHLFYNNPSEFTVDFILPLE